MKITIENQGQPIINGAMINQQCTNLIAFEVDLKSKNCEVDCIFLDNHVPGIGIAATEYSLYLDTSQPHDSITTILFPKFNGWDVWCATIGRYTLRGCLIKL